MGCREAVIRLDKLEAPYPPPESVLAALEKGLQELNRYSDEGLAEELRSELASHHGLEEDSVTLLGSRATAVLAVLGLVARLRKRRPRLVAPSPGLQELRRLLESHADGVIEVALVEQDESWRIPLDELLGEIGKADLVVLDNPSDPTGSLILRSLGEARDLLEEACRRETIVLMDESFYEFSGFSIADLVEPYPCLIVMRSMEQAYALAGTGLAYLVSSDKLAQELSRLAPLPSRLSLLAGLAALRNQGYYFKMVERLIAERERTRQLLLGLSGVYAYRSWSSFLLIRTSIERVAEKLCSQGVAVAGTTLGNNYARISIGNQGDNNSLLAALTRLLMEESKLS